MFGLVDYVEMRRNPHRNLEESFSFNTEKIIYDNSKTLVILFLPWRTSIQRAKKLNLIPEKGTLLIIENPNNIVNSEPSAIKKSCKLMVSKTLSQLKLFDTKKYDKVEIVGYSSGSIPAFLLAATKKYNFTKLITICPGPRGEELIWTSPALEDIKEKAIRNGFSKEKFKEILDDVDPITAIEDIQCNIEIYLGRFDRYMPYRLSKPFRELKKSNLKIVVYPFFGHFLTVLRSSRILKKKL